LSTLLVYKLNIAHTIQNVFVSSNNATIENRLYISINYFKIDIFDCWTL